MNIVRIQRFSTHDGPGIRTVVFLKGCPLRCRWCHNPETQLEHSQVLYQKALCIGCRSCAAVCASRAHLFSDAGDHTFDVSRCTNCLDCADVCPTGAIEISGKQTDVGGVMAVVGRDRAFYGRTGGLTLSGGEPMFQPEAALALLRAAKESGITTAIETCGCFPARFIAPLAEVTDTFLWDFKAGVSETHRLYTGFGNEAILRNLTYADAFAKSIILRCIMVKGVNMDTGNLSVLAGVASELKHCDGVELIPYHAYGGSKAEQLGGKDNGNTDWIPSSDDIASASAYLREKRLHII